MNRQFGGLALAIMLCLTVSLAHGEPKEKEKSGEKTPSKEPQGQSSAQHKTESSSEPTGSTAQNGKQSSAPASSQPNGSGATSAVAANANKNQTSQPTAAEGAAAANAANKNKTPQATGAEGAAAGAAATNNKNPQATGAQGAAAGVAAANRNSSAMSSPVAVTAGYAAVQNSFHDPNIYGAQWYGSHPGAWAASGWTAGTAWQPSTWGAVAGMIGYANAAPISYNYGVNVTAQDGNMMVNGQNVGTTAQFSQQAADLAATGANANVSTTDQWMPLGVFAMVRDESQTPQFIVQLAINKQGILRGNYTDENSANTLPIRGAVDQKTQRAAWMVGDNKQSIMEAGLSDLTASEAPALIHKDGKTDHWILIRLAQSK
jgi:hypothetical protein